MLTNYLLLFFCITLAVIAQLSMSHGMDSVGEIRDPSSIPSMLIRSFGNPYVLLGYILYGVSSLVWLIVLSRVEVSLAYPTMATSYVLVVILSRFLLGDHVSPLRLAGTLVICLGVYLISRTY